MGQTLASGQSRIIPLSDYGIQTHGKLKSTLTEHTDAVMSIAFSPDGKTLASGSRDRTIRLWNPRTLENLKTTLTGYTDWINPVAFSPDGQYLACGRYNTIRLWNTQTGEYKNISERHTGHILSLAFSPDGTTLASGAEDGYGSDLWDVQTLLEEQPSLDKRFSSVRRCQRRWHSKHLGLWYLYLQTSEKTGENIADVNGDGIVNIVDLVKVAGADGCRVQPHLQHMPQTLEILTAAERAALAHTSTARKPHRCTTSQRGILMLAAAPRITHPQRNLAIAQLSQIHSTRKRGFRISWLKVC